MPSPRPEPPLVRIAASLPGVTETAHAGRRAFRLRRIFATLAPDGRSANLRLAPEVQDHWAARLPGIVAPLPGTWGAQGWTGLDLASVTAEDLELLLHHAWQSAGGPPP